jgi:hypothetical protein
MYFEHKSCAVKLHAYTLDSSGNLASALQQNMLFPQLLVIVLFFAHRHDKGMRPARLVSSTANHQSFESNAET